MKKILSVLSFIALISACSDKNEEALTLPLEEALEQGEVVVVPPQIDIAFEGKIYEYDIASLAKECDKDNEITCAIDLTVKCTINSKLSQCDENKLPKFIFMEDESLERPTKFSFEIVKIKPISPDMIEVYTKSTCNGGWFGLCNGNIIYVLSNKSGSWNVKDIYAMQSY